MKTDERTQSKLVAIRTILPPQVVVNRIREFSEEVALAWAVHDSDASNIHSHIMCRFDGVRRWGWLRQWLNERDPHNRCVAADSWRRGVRYLLHLDNPEKPVVPRSSLCTYNIDDDDLSMLLAGRSSSLLPALRECASMSPYDAFAFLVERRGFRPSECTAGINLLMALQRMKTVRGDLAVSFVLPESAEEHFDRLDEEAIDTADWLDEWETREARRGR